MALPRNWEAQILRGIRAPVTPQNVRFLDAWQRAEGGGTANNANFNPLNTTQGAAGAGSINSVGVKSYRSGGQGIAATVQTLLNGHYGDIVSGLRSGRASANQLAHSHSLSTWGTGSGVLRVLGAGGDLRPSESLARAVTPGAPAGPQMPAQASPNLFKQAAVGYLLQSSQDLASGHVDPNGILGLALARQALQQPAPQVQNLAQNVVARRAPVPGGGGSVKFTGRSLSGENPQFIQRVRAAVASIGGTQVRVNSGYRSPAHNRAVGGAPNSNHIYGRAMDADVYIQGRGWVPLGLALKGSASKFGLRSGATFNWGGRPDLPHVDDGYNQRR